MSRWSLIALVALGLGRGAAAQELPVDLDLDYAAFLYTEDEAMLELYLSVGASSLSYVTEDSQLVAALPVEIALRPISAAAPAGASAEPVLEESAALRFAVADTSALGDGQYFVELFRTAVPPGEYTLDLTVPPEGDRDELRLSVELTAPDFVQEGHATVSGVTLASSIREGEADARFYKNGLVVVPNPGALFGSDQDRLFYYAEAYGLPGATDQQQYTLFAFLSESGRPDPIEGHQRRGARAVRDPDVLVGSFDVDDLPTGSYFLHLVFLDENNEALAEQTKRFYVYNPDVERPAAAVGADEGYEASLYAIMSEEEVEANLRHAAVIATQQELAQMRQLADLEAKRAWLAAFWRRRDTDSDPSENQARRDFYERLRYADERYATPFREGYEVDRGRVLLRYGYPAQVDPRPFDQQLVPHEIWTYENIPGHGSAVFVFADREGLGEYDLIHSTVTGEVTAPNWEQMLQR
ncbi:MAG TPA: GWxTD domain-containing protein [Rubricoccaceae bacterium]|nr:GWxTD domain-containing protein [Rubricoccaceae bacterium]